MDKLILSNVLVIAAGIGIGTGRAVPTVAALVGLIGVVSGAIALVRSSGRLSTGSRRFLAIVAGIGGLVSTGVGGLHSANVAGGLGTGNGLAGAIVAVVMGLISMALSGLALTRLSQRDQQSPPR